MWKKFTRGYQQLVRDEPGWRFRNANERWKVQNQSPAVGIVIIGTGILLIVLGALLSLVPGIPGIILGIPGLALIATRSHKIAWWLDWIEIKCRKLLQKWRKRKALR